MVCIAGLAWCVQRLQQIDPFARLNPLYADAGMGNVLVRFSETEVVARQLNTPLWRMKVQRADLARDRQRWLLDGVQEAVLYDDGKPAWRLTAAQAMYEGASRFLQVADAHLYGNPVRLTCSQATWRDQTRELQCLRASFGGPCATASSAHKRCAIWAEKSVSWRKGDAGHAYFTGTCCFPAGRPPHAEQR
jgi:hypothetical protein